MALEDYPFFQKSERERLLEIRDLMSIEDRLDGVPTEELLKRLAPDERLRGLAPDERLRGLAPDEFMSALEKVLTPDLARRLKERLH